MLLNIWIYFNFRFNQPFFLKMSTRVQRQENGYCYLIVRFCVCCILMFLLCRSSPLIFDVFLSVLVCNPDLFFLNRLMNFEQRYTTIAFIYQFKSSKNPSAITNRVSNASMLKIKSMVTIK